MACFEYETKKMYRLIHKVIGHWNENNYLFKWGPTKDGPSDGNSRVEMSSRDMTNRVTHDHYNKPPSDTYPWKCYRAIDLIHCYRTTSSKHHKICPNDFCNHLVSIKRKWINQFTCVLFYFIHKFCVQIHVYCNSKGFILWKMTCFALCIQHVTRTNFHLFHLYMFEWDILCIFGITVGISKSQWSLPSIIVCTHILNISLKN